MLFCLYLLVGFHWFHSVVWFRSKNGSDIALALKKSHFGNGSTVQTSCGWEANPFGKDSDANPFGKDSDASQPSFWQGFSL